jgi:hypothetical protein
MLSVEFHYIDIEKWAHCEVDESIIDQYAVPRPDKWESLTEEFVDGDDLDPWADGSGQMEGIPGFGQPIQPFGIPGFGQPFGQPTPVFGEPGYFPTSGENMFQPPVDIFNQPQTFGSYVQLPGQHVQLPMIAPASPMYAGGGKTHSVIEFIKNHSDLNILAMSHTKAAKDEIIDRIKKGLRTMPDNITVKTFDGFAWDNAREVLPVAPDDYKWCMNGSGEWFTKMILNKCREQNISTAECLSRRRRVQSTHTLNRHILLEKYVQKSYDIVIIDEAQDLCTVALKFLEECRRFSRFVIYVGDEKQCIYQPECIFAKDITDVTKFQFTHTFRYDGLTLLLGVDAPFKVLNDKYRFEGNLGKSGTCDFYVQDEHVVCPGGI